LSTVAVVAAVADKPATPPRPSWSVTRWRWWMEERHPPYV